MKHLVGAFSIIGSILVLIESNYASSIETPGNSETKEVKECGCDQQYIEKLVAIAVAREMRKLQKKLIIMETNDKERSRENIEKRANGKMRPFYLV